MAKARPICGLVFITALAQGGLGPASAFGQAPSNSPYLEVLPAKKANKLLLKQHTPEYPAIAKINYIQGQVRIQAIVTSEGEVAEVHVVRGHPFLAVAALKAIRNWLFKPAKSRQGPAEFQTFVDVNFALHTRKIVPLPDKPESDLTRQVRPPELLEKLPDTETGEVVRLRVLVGSKGEVLDAQPLLATANHLREARRVVANWSFRPARWGAVAVPWYLDVDVPVETWPAAQGGADPGGR
jgi:TonB family protein